MPTKFLLFQRFISREAAQDVVALLAANGIEGQVKDERPLTDGVFTFQNHPTTLLLLRGSDFGPARELLRRATESQVAAVPDDHYLFTFTDPELWQILVKPDEWSALDMALAQRILRERDYDVSPATVAAMAARRTDALAEPQDVTAGWLVAGYGFSALGGLIGILLGWYLSTHLTTLPDGRQVPAYSAHSRFHGRVMLVMGAVVFVAVVLSRTLLRAI